MARGRPPGPAGKAERGLVLAKSPATAGAGWTLTWFGNGIRSAPIDTRASLCAIMFAYRASSWRDSISAISAVLTKNLCLIIFKKLHQRGMARHHGGPMDAR